MQFRHPLGPSLAQGRANKPFVPPAVINIARYHQLQQQGVNASTVQYETLLSLFYQRYQQKSQANVLIRSLYACTPTYVG
jgi:hypothetical protein